MTNNLDYKDIKFPVSKKIIQILKRKMINVFCYDKVLQEHR